MSGLQAVAQASQMRLGAWMRTETRAEFLVWAPLADEIDLHIMSPEEQWRTLAPAGNGYFSGFADGAGPGTLYKYRLNRGAEFPDPASQHQPLGVHGPSAIMSHDFEWQDLGWRGLALAEYIIYEMHIGTFTPEGTFDAAIDYLDYLKDLGITAIEFMPVAQFSGNRNWGYDGVYPFAVQDSYGGPRGLRRIVEAAHRRGMAVVLDVVYNHLGPEGNYLASFGPYFTERYKTPWGPAINFDGERSAAVRRFFIENALRWIRDFHVDALRLDAVHAIFDGSPTHILRELAQAVHAYAEESGRSIQVIAESDLNSSKLVEAPEHGGVGLDAQWSDDFHHSDHCLLTGERAGYYSDFGSLEHLAKAIGEGFVYSGQFSAFRGEPHGTSSLHLPAERFVVCTQNHDQVGNRMRGERSAMLLRPEQLKLEAGILLVSPFIPLLFMGQEYGEVNPFLYFVSHSDPALIQGIREGRRREFAAFLSAGELPDAQMESTFERCRLNHSARDAEPHRTLLEFYKALIRLRKDLPALRRLTKDPATVHFSEEHELLTLTRGSGPEAVLTVFHFGSTPTPVVVPSGAGIWRKILDSADRRWLGPGSSTPEVCLSEGLLEFVAAPHSVTLFHKG